MWLEQEPPFPKPAMAFSLWSSGSTSTESEIIWWTPYKCTYCITGNRSIPMSSCCSCWDYSTLFGQFYSNPVMQSFDYSSFLHISLKFLVHQVLFQWSFLLLVTFWHLYYLYLSFLYLGLDCTFFVTDPIMFIFIGRYQFSIHTVEVLHFAHNQG